MNRTRAIASAAADVWTIVRSIKSFNMNPTSLGIDIAAVQRKTEIDKYAGSEQFVDEGLPNTFNNIQGVRHHVTCSLNDI